MGTPSEVEERRHTPFHPRNDTFPGELLVELAADALDAAGVSRQSPLAFEGSAGGTCPRDVLTRTPSTTRASSPCAPAAMIHGGVDAGLLDEVQWWRTDDFWFWALEALTAYTRAAADRTGQPLASVASGIRSHDASSPTIPQL